MTPPAIQSPIIHVADETFIATRLGNWKMPAPMTIPTTIEAAEATDKQRRGCACAGGVVVIGRKARAARASYARGGFRGRWKWMGTSRGFAGRAAPCSLSAVLRGEGGGEGVAALHVLRRSIRRVARSGWQRYDCSPRTLPLSPALSPQTDAGRGSGSLSIL